MVQPSMPTFELDQVSQMLGAQGAQLTSLTGAIGELRAEILQNRVHAQEHREREIREWEKVGAELRNVKHESRATQQDVIVLESRLQKVEQQIDVWSGKLSIIGGLAGFAGVVVGGLIEPLIRHAIDRVIG